MRKSILLFSFIYFFSSFINLQNKSFKLNELIHLLEITKENRQISLMSNGWDLSQNSDTHELWEFGNEEFNVKDGIFIDFYQGKGFKDIMFHFFDKESFVKFKNETKQNGFNFIQTTNYTFEDLWTKKEQSGTKSIYSNDKYKCEFTMSLASTDPFRIPTYSIKISKIYY